VRAGLERALRALWKPDAHAPPEALHGLLHVLRAADASLRDRAAADLLRLSSIAADPTTDAVEALRGALTSQDAVVRDAGLHVADLLGGRAEAVAPALVALLRDEATRDRATACLRRMGSAVVAPLVRAMGQELAADHTEAIGVLRTLGDPAIHEAVRMLGADIPAERLGAVGALRLLGDRSPATAEALLGCLGDPDSFVRAASVQALGEWKDAKLLPELARMLGDAEDAVRLEAVRAVHAGGKPGQASPDLMRACGDANPLVRAAAIRAVADLCPSTPEVVALLVSGAVDRSPEVRDAAAHRLDRFDAATAPALGEMLAELDPERRGIVLRRLEDLGPKGAAAAPRVIPLLVAEDRDVAEAASAALAAMGPSIVGRLAAALDPKNPGMCLAVLAVLGEFGPDAGVEGATAVCRLLGSDDEGTQRAASSALVRIGAPAAPVVLAMLADKDAAKRIMAAKAFGRMRAVPGSVVRALSDGLKDRDPEVRMCCLEALARVTVPKPELLAACLRDENQEVSLRAFRLLVERGADSVGALRDALRDSRADIRRLGAKGLGRIGGGGPAGHKALLEALADREREVRDEAVRALGQAGAAVLADLTSALENTNWRVRCHAAEALGLLGKDARPARSALRLRLTDENHEVRQAAGEALQSIGG
jgi:HEAT repeat protein